MFFERRKRRQKSQRGNAGGHTGIERWRRPVVLLLCIAMVSMYSGVIPSVSAAGDDVPGTEAGTGEISGDTNTGDNSTGNTQEPGNTETTGNAAENQNPQEPSESSEPVGCEHHPVHTEECGYTDENPVCGFVCAVCSVQKQIDEIIDGGSTEIVEMDEAAIAALCMKINAAYAAYQALTSEQQKEIEGADILQTMMETLNTQTLDAGDSAVDGMKIVTAEIRADGMSNQALSDGRSFTVDFSKQFTLHIEVESKLNLANKKVKITVPDGLTVVEYPIPERGGMAESVTPESIDELHSENNYGGYCPTNGTITYSLKNTAEKNSFNIVLAPDTTLWNRRSEQKLEDSSFKIEVYTDAQTYQTISATPKITGKYNDAAGDNRAIQTGPRLSRVGVKSGVPTAANQPFALRQIWINPDKDYIDMPQFFKKLEITIALPYYTKNGSNIYAEFDHITWDPAGQSTRPNLL
ncbi:MAG: hypothetical protein MR303_05085, partial [Emergencia sp.]|nr:hypothetical protein [Emergencia sp.]